MNFLRHSSFSFLFLIAALFLLPFAGVKGIFFGVPIYLPEAAIIFSLGAFFFGREKKVKNFFPDRWVLFGVMFFIGGSILSFFWNPFSWTGLGMLKSWFLFPLLFGFLIGCHGHQESRRQRILFSWWGVMSAVAIANLSLFFQGIVTYDGRLAGSYSSPNFLAVFVAPMVLLSSYFLLVRQEKDPLWQKGIFALGGVAGLMTVFLTRSYETWVALFCSLVFLLGIFAFQKRISKRILWVGGFFLVLALIVAIGLERGTEKWQVFTTGGERSSVHSRIMIWEAALQIVADHPLLGIGVGRFQEEYLSYQKYFPPYLEWAVPEPHNIFLAVFLSTGMLGLAGFLLMLFRFFFLLLSQVSKKEEATLLLSLMVLLLLYGLTDTPYFKTDLCFLFFLIFFLGLSLIQKDSSFQEK